MPNVVVQGVLNLSDPKTATYTLAKKLFEDELLSSNLTGRTPSGSDNRSKERQKLDPKKVQAIEGVKKFFFAAK